MTPFFSIVIPVYNVAPYLRECLDSVLAQTFADWEALCVDDGSTDGSGAILDEYAAKDSRIKVLHTGNRGVSAARNSGIDAASGEYVTFLDGDDAYERFWLESFYGLIKETGAELVRLRVKFWNGGAHESGLAVDRPHRACFVGDEVVSWGCPTYSLEGWSWLNAIRRSCLNGAVRVRFPVGMKFMEDNVFMMNALPHVHAACQGEVSGYLYRQRATSVCLARKSAQVVVRLFDETVPLFAAMSAANRKCLSGMLGRSVLYWCERRDRDEIGGAAIVRARIVAAMKDSMFHVSDMPVRWRLGFVAMLHLHSLLVMDLLLFLQRTWGCARRLRKGIIRGKR
ncbi:MAG: glycosyltransferase family 2 protein [Kiritimatiellae bacterium]|nr:glycosyltransferase family 2 protein [Kiritimatiellia bacterium]